MTVHGFFIQKVTISRQNIVQYMGVRRGEGKKGICPPWKFGLRSKHLLKT